MKKIALKVTKTMLFILGATLMLSGCQNMEGINDDIDQNLSVKTTSDYEITDTQDDNNDYEEQNANIPKYRLMLIAGHGDGDVGAVYNGRQEATYNQQFVNKLEKKLRQENNNIEILLEEKEMRAAEEAKLIASMKPDFALSIHFNAGKGTGSEIIVPFQDQNLQFAFDFIDELANNDFKIRPATIFSKSSSRKVVRKINDRITIENDYYAVIRSGAQNNIQSYILEVEFIDNEAQMAIYDARIDEYIAILANQIGLHFKK